MTGELIQPQTGTAFELSQGSFLKVVDLKGEQVCDMVLFNKHDKKERLSSGKTLDFEESLLITKGNKLWSNRSQIMATVMEDTNGCNDMILAPCSKETFKYMYDHEGEHPSCLDNLDQNLSLFGIDRDDIPNAFNIFMNVRIDMDGKISVVAPSSKEGDYLIIKAEMDLIVGLTACSAEDSNGGTFKPIWFEIF